MLLRDVYYPTGMDFECPTLYSPEHVLYAAARMVEVRSAALLAVGREGMAMVEPLRDAIPDAFFKFDVLLGRSAFPEEKEYWREKRDVKLRPFSSLQTLPATKLYDFIYIS